MFLRAREEGYNMSCDWLSLTSSGIRSIHPYQPGKPISELQRELGLSDIIKLASNENPLGASSNVLSCLSTSMNEVARYPDGNAFHLKQRLSERLDVAADCLTIGNGSNDVLEMIARVFAQDDDEIIISQHAFAVYGLVAKAVGATLIETPAKTFGHDLEAMIHRVSSKTKLVFLANPNNPTGTYFSKEALSQFLNSIPNHVIVVVDEAYFEYVQHQDYPNALTYLNHHPNLIVTRTFSKAYGLAALRLGYAVSHPDIADLLNRIRQPFNANLLAQNAAVVALDDQDFLKKSVAFNQEELNLMMNALDQLNVEYIPSVGNFVSIRVPSHTGRECFDQLLRQGIIVRPVSEYGLDEFIRVSIGLKDENTQFLNAFKCMFQL